MSTELASATPTGDPQVRRAVLAHLRHELRTPINAIIGYSEMLLEDVEDGSGSAHAPDLQKIRLAGGQLLERVSHILDVDRLEAAGGGLDMAEIQSLLRAELGTPAGSIVGYTDLLQEDAVGSGLDGWVDDLQRIRTAGLVRLTEGRDPYTLPAGGPPTGSIRNPAGRGTCRAPAGCCRSPRSRDPSLSAPSGTGNRSSSSFRDPRSPAGAVSEPSGSQDATAS